MKAIFGFILAGLIAALLLGIAAMLALILIAQRASPSRGELREGIDRGVSLQEQDSAQLLTKLSALQSNLNILERVVMERSADWAKASCIEGVIMLRETDEPSGAEYVFTSKAYVCGGDLRFEATAKGMEVVNEKADDSGGGLADGN